MLAGRVSTPTLQEQGGSRHHLDGTTPFVVKTEEKPTEGTQPFFPVLSDQVYLLPLEINKKLNKSFLARLDRLRY